MSRAALPLAFPGERISWDGPAGRLAATVTGQGPPLLLVHSINAAASAAEMRPLAERFATSHTVFCVDLPGFGASERSDRPYTPRLMTDAVHDAVERLCARTGAERVDALGLSLSSEFVARAASERAERYRSLALVSPTGFRGGQSLRGPRGSTRAVPGLYRALRGPGWGAALFRGLTRPGVIRYFLRRTWGARDVDETLWAYDVISTRQPGAHYAPLYFLSGGLFSADMHDVYESLRAPVWMVHGVRGDFTDYRGRTLVEGRPHWSFSVLPTGALPFFEVPDEFTRLYREFLMILKVNSNSKDAVPSVADRGVAT